MATSTPSIHGPIRVVTTAGEAYAGRITISSINATQVDFTGQSTRWCRTETNFLVTPGNFDAARVVVFVGGGQTYANMPVAYCSNLGTLYFRCQESPTGATPRQYNFFAFVGGTNLVP